MDTDAGPAGSSANVRPPVEGDRGQGQNGSSGEGVPAEVHDGDLWEAEPDVAVRQIRLSNDFVQRCRAIPRNTIERIPAGSAGCMANAWAEAMENILQGNAEWGVVAECRARLLLAGAYEEDVDKPAELKQRLRLWERGELEDLLGGTARP